MQFGPFVRRRTDGTSPSGGDDAVGAARPFRYPRYLSDVRRKPHQALLSADPAGAVLKRSSCDDPAGACASWAVNV